MNAADKYIGNLFLPARFFMLTGFCILLFVLSFFIPPLYSLAKAIFLIFILLVVLDYLALFLFGKGPVIKRIMSDRLSNGDENVITLNITSRMNFPVNIEIVDELPFQFQARDFMLKRPLGPKEKLSLGYTVRPSQRGVYEFGRVLLYIRSGLGMVSRRVIGELSRSVAVYPSFMRIGKYQLLGEAKHLNETGSRRIRKIGQSMEFEQIKDYITGDDIRNINWKATARKGNLMVNNYTDEKSQQVYCIIDKGRLMKMPFNGLTLLDYAINSTLVMSSVCLQKQDKVGLVTFADRMGDIVAADRKPVQRENLLQVLYRQQTGFLESDFELLYLQVRTKIKQRSLLVLYTNFESLNGLRRQINYLRAMAKHHLLLVVFFENTELTSLAHAETSGIEDVYVKTIAGKFVNEKKLIVKELMKYGILSILTSPENLNVNTVNKYLELKTKHAI